MGGTDDKKLQQAVHLDASGGTIPSVTPAVVKATNDGKAQILTIKFAGGALFLLTLTLCYLLVAEKEKGIAILAGLIGTLVGYLVAPKNNK